VAPQAFQLLCMGDLAFMENVRSYDPALPSARLVTGNVEIVISNDPGPPAEKLVHLLAGNDTAEAYGDLDLDVVTLANNHSVDYGTTGLSGTISALQEQGLQVVGAGENIEAARTPVITGAAGPTVGFVGISCVVPPGFAASTIRPGIWAIRVRSYLESETSNEQPGAAPFVHTIGEKKDIDCLKAELATLREKVDVTVMHVHWGVPPPWQTPFQGPLATYQRQLITDLGEVRPNVVIGHHPHVLHGVEWIENTLVMYSLGHLVFQPWGSKYATSPDELILGKAEDMGAAALHPPYESLEDERNWDGCVSVVNLETNSDNGLIRATKCSIYPYEIERASGLGFPATDPVRATAILNQVTEHTKCLSDNVSVEYETHDSRLVAVLSPRLRS